MFRQIGGTQNVNLYSASSRLNYKKMPLLDIRNARTFSILKKLYQRDKQNVNHLLVELVLVSNAENASQASFHRYKLCQSEESGAFAFLPTESNSPIIDFTSRKYKEGVSEIAGNTIYHYVAETNPMASYSHSEALFVGFLSHSPEVFEVLLKKPEIGRVEGVYFIYYSSLDACDQCESLLECFHASIEAYLKKHQRLENISVKYAFCSFSPCKKSGYCEQGTQGIESVVFNKKAQCFFKENALYKPNYGVKEGDFANPYYNAISYIDYTESLQ